MRVLNNLGTLKNLKKNNGKVQQTAKKCIAIDKIGKKFPFI